MARLFSCGMVMLAVAGAVANADITNITQGTTHATIQDAIDAAVAGDAIVVDPGTYYEHLDMSGKAITLRSQDPTDPATVVATILHGSDAGRVLSCDEGEGPDTLISGFVITGGSAADGGGMLNFGASPTVTYCTFMHNTASSGGGGAMLNAGGSSPTVKYCTFAENAGNPFGGAIENLNAGAASFVECVFIRNDADMGSQGNGGAVYSWNGTAAFTRCRFIDNTGTWASAIHCDGTTSLTFTGCVFSQHSGGPVLQIEFDANATLRDTVIGANASWPISGNYTDAGGNAIGSDFMPPPMPEEETCPQDINGDGVVDLADLGALLAVFGQACP